MKRISVAFASSAIVLIVLFIACRKNDIPTNVKTSTTESKFFEHSSNITSQTQRVLDEFKKRNTNSDFIASFAKKYGSPVWDKSMSRPQHQKSFATNSVNNDANDTTIIIPIVSPNSTSVQAYIEATLTDQVQLYIHTANQYNSLPFANATTQVNSAEKLAAMFMVLNNNVFGHSSFKITDKRLFHSSNNYGDTNHLQEKVVLKTNNVNSTSLLSLDAICMDVLTTKYGHALYRRCRLPAQLRHVSIMCNLL